MTESIAPLEPRHGRATPQSQAPVTAAPADWSLDHVSFGDVLSALNPLQYLPVVGMIYREITGDTVPPALRIAVSGVTSVFLGPLGVAATMLCAAGGEVLHEKSNASGANWPQASAAYRQVGRAW